MINLLSIFKKNKSNSTPCNEYYNVYKIRQSKFYGLCGEEHFYVAYRDVFLSTEIKGLTKGELVMSFATRGEMLKYSPKMIFNDDYIEHHDEYEPLDFKV